MQKGKLYRHLSSGSSSLLHRKIGVSEQALGWFPPGIIMEDEPSGFSLAHAEDFTPTLQSMVAKWTRSEYYCHEND